MIFPLFPFAPENSVSRDRFDRPILQRQPAHPPHSRWIYWYLLMKLLPLSVTGGIRLFLPSTATRPVLSLSGHHSITYRWRSLPRVCRLRASSPQVSCSNGCCLFRCHHGPFFVSISFPPPTNNGTNSRHAMSYATKYPRYAMAKAEGSSIVDEPGEG